MPPGACASKPDKQLGSDPAPLPVPPAPMADAAPPRAQQQQGATAAGAALSATELKRHKSVTDLSELALSIVVVGASGHLARTKTYPAIYELFVYGLLPPAANVVGYARSSMTDDEFRATLSKSLKSGTPENRAEFLSRCYYHSGEYGSEEAFRQLSARLGDLESRTHPGGANRLFYLAIPPSVFAEAGGALKRGATSATGWNRVVVEKPFGRDSASSAELGLQLSAHFAEDQLFRIDHYLGKEMVQNLMVLRFANTVFEPLWNNKYVSNVVITFKERDGVEGRGGYFDTFGIIRDVMQNHLMQILTLVAMEAPVTLEAEDIRDEKVKVLRAMRQLQPADMIVGQYGPDPEGKKPGYAQDPSVPAGSLTPTFALGTFWIDNPRWSGVPFVLKCGKALDERKAEIRVQFKAFPGPRFPVGPKTFEEAGVEQEVRAAAPDYPPPPSGGRADAPGPINELVIRVQPDEAIYLKMATKAPGLSESVQQSELNLSYGSRFGVTKLPDAYERLILDVLRGDHHLFVRDDELKFAWHIFTPLLHYLERERVQPMIYPLGSRGPAAGDARMRELGVLRYTNYKWDKEAAGPAGKSSL